MRRLVLTALIALLAVPAAAGASVDAIYADCQDGRLDKLHQKSDLREAAKDMPADLDEYTNCRELIRAAREDRVGGGGSGPGHNPGEYTALPTGEGGLPLGPDKRPIDPRGIASEQERQQLDSVREGADVTGTQVSGVAPGSTGGADVPLPLIALLVLTAAATIALVVPRLIDLVRSRLA